MPKQHSKSSKHRPVRVVAVYASDAVLQGGRDERLEVDRLLRTCLKLECRALAHPLPIGDGLGPGKLFQKATCWHRPCDISAISCSPLHDKLAHQIRTSVLGHGADAVATTCRFSPFQAFFSL